MQRPHQTWQERRAAWDEARRTPDALAALADRVRAAGVEYGLAAVGVTTAAPLTTAREQINRRVAAGQHAGMVFTFTRPEKATTPERLLPNAAAVVVGALGYNFLPPDFLPPDVPHGDSPSAPGTPVEHLPVHLPAGATVTGRIARYQWIDQYGVLRQALQQVAAVLRADGWKTRVLADDNALVDRAAAHRAGIGWFGKNANILIPGHGSWFVLGSIVTDAPLPAAQEPVPDGCGSCTRCLPGCPTGAIVEPGVIDARRCLAWLVQAPGTFPMEFREALHDRIYGCDDCQEVCPENRVAARREPPPVAPPHAVPDVELAWLAAAPDAAILERFGRWWLPDRNPDVLRRNAVIALGNVANPHDQSVIDLLTSLAAAPSPDGASPQATALVAEHATWALGRLSARR